MYFTINFCFIYYYLSLAEIKVYFRVKLPSQNLLSKRYDNHIILIINVKKFHSFNLLPSYQITTDLQSYKLQVCYKKQKIYFYGHGIIPILWKIYKLQKASKTKLGKVL